MNRKIKVFRIFSFCFCPFPLSLFFLKWHLHRNSLHVLRIRIQAHNQSSVIFVGIFTFFSAALCLSSIVFFSLFFFYIKIKCYFFGFGLCVNQIKNKEKEKNLFISFGLRIEIFIPLMYLKSNMNVAFFSVHCISYDAHICFSSIILTWIAVLFVRLPFVSLFLFYSPHL